MDWVPVTDRLPPFGKNVLACCWMSVIYFVAYVSPVDGKWHRSFGDTGPHRWKNRPRGEI
jgi:hypothetical protein